MCEPHADYYKQAQPAAVAAAVPVERLIVAFGSPEKHSMLTQIHS